VKEIIGLIVFGLFWFISYIAKQAEQKQKQEAAERQRKLPAARQQQQDATTRDAPKKKFKQIEQLHGRNDEAFVAAKSVSPPPLRRESVFDEPIDGVAYNTEAEPSGLATDTAPMARQLSETANPIAQEIMALMATPQSMQQVVILSEIFSRPKFE
jgi:hypothetical protein